MRKSLTAFGFLISVAVLPGCDQDDAPARVAPSTVVATGTVLTATVDAQAEPTNQSLEVIRTAARMPLAHGKSVETLTTEYPVVLFGQVEEITYREGAEDSSGTVDVYTLADVRVDRWVSPPEPGSEATLRVVQPGGVWQDEYLVVFESDEIMEEGDRYFFFLRRPVEGSFGYVGVAFGRFRADSGVLEPIAEFDESLGAVAELRGMTEDEAAVRVSRALEQQATPTPSE
jgi:hypothetical protein